jgi:hypothetical protein
MSRRTGGSAAFVRLSDGTRTDRAGEPVSVVEAKPAMVELVPNGDHLPGFPAELSQTWRLRPMQGHRSSRPRKRHGAT